MKKFLRLLIFPIYNFYYGASFRVSSYLKLILFFKNTNLKAALFLSNRLQKTQGVFVSPHATFDNSLTLKHPIGIVIGEGVTIGANVTIYQNVTIGGARIGDAKANHYPTIGKNTVIFSGAAIIGKVNIGDNCVIGANSVVTTDIPDNSVAVGAPAKIVNKGAK